MRPGDSIPLHDYSAKRIALIKPSSLGDIVHSLPVLTAIRQRYPKATIAWVINRDLEPLIRGHPDLDYTLPFDREACRAGLLPAATTYRRFFRKLRRENFDLVVDLQGLLRSGLMTAACRAGAAWGSARPGKELAGSIPMSFQFRNPVRCMPWIVTGSSPGPLVLEMLTRGFTFQSRSRTATGRPSYLVIAHAPGWRSQWGLAGQRNAGLSITSPLWPMVPSRHSAAPCCSSAGLKKLGLLRGLRCDCGARCETSRGRRPSVS